GMTQEELADKADVSVLTVKRAEQGGPVDLSSVSLIATALQLNIEAIVKLGSPPEAGTFLRHVVPGLDPSASLLDALRELHTAGKRMIYFHRSVPYQLLPRELISKYNSIKSLAVRSFFDQVGVGRLEDYDRLRGQDQLECVMLWSDLMSLARREGEYSHL